MIAVLLAFLLQDLEASLQELGGESAEGRAEAARRIKTLGSAALPRLDEASRAADPELAARARRLAALIRLAEREKLPAELASLDEALLDRGPAAWIDALETRRPDDEAWRYLASRAALAAASDPDRRRVCAVLEKRPAGADGLLSWFRVPKPREDRDEEILKQAVQLLLRLKARRELHHVVTVYGRFDPDDRFRMADPNLIGDAMRALVELKAVDEIRDIARRPDGQSAHDAVEALADLQVRDAVPDLLQHLSGASPWVRHHAARGLGLMGVREAVPGLLKLLDDPDDPPRRGAIEALGRLGVAEAAPRLIPLVDDPQSWVQVVAMRALVALRHEPALTALRKASRHATPGVRAIAFESLLALNPGENVEAALEDDKPAVRAYAAAALCRLGSRKGVPALLRLAEKPVEVHLNVDDRLGGGGVELPPHPLLILNAARSPALWRRLEERTLPRPAEGLVGPDLDAVASAAGLRPEISALVDGSARYYFAPISAGWTLRQAVESLTLSGRVAMILEGDRLRALPADEALEEWKRWWKEQGGGDPAFERRRAAIAAMLTPGLRGHLDRLAEGPDETWAALAVELAGQKLPEEDRALLFAQGMRTAPAAAQKAKLLPLGGEAAALAALNDPAWELRAAAVALLDPAKHEAAILSKAGDPSTAVAGAVLELAVKLRTPEGLEALKSLSLHAEWIVSDRASMHLSFRDEPALIPHMIGLLGTSKKNFASAQFALRFLGAQGAREAVPAILKLLDEPRPHCRNEAYRALLELGAREALPRVIALARRNEMELHMAMPLLGAWQAKEAAREIRALLPTSAPAAEALARMGDVESLPALRALLKHEEPSMREAACEALSRLEGAKAKAAVLEAFRDPAVTPAAALARVGATESAAELAARMKGFDAAWLKALGQLGAPPPEPVLRTLEKPTEDWRQAEALQILGRSWPAAARPLLPAYEAAASDAHRRAAATLRCEWGEPAGATAELREKAEPCLNALRRPAVWARLREARLEGPLYATGSQLAARLAEAAGLRFEDLPAGARGHAAWSVRHVLLDGPLKGLELLEKLQGPHWAPLLEDGTLRIAPLPEAVALWKAWTPSR